MPHSELTIDGLGGDLREMFHVELPAGFDERLGKFHQELLDWNPSASLVSSRATQAELMEHSLDSLALLPYLDCDGISDRIHFDIGSGGGYPAVPLALARPDREIVCVERNARKVAFLTRVAKVLGLSNLRIVHEDFASTQLPDECSITARAIEHPESFAVALQTSWLSGWRFLSQLANSSAYFHPPLDVQEVVDELDRYRRGSLYLVQSARSSTWNQTG